MNNPTKAYDLTADAPVPVVQRDGLVRLHVATWIKTEREQYADRKYEVGGDAWWDRLNDIKDNGLSLDSTEMVLLTNYLKRAELLGIDNLAGRQAFGKFVVTATAILERIVTVHGDMPKPGLTTGEVEEWT